MGESRTTDHGRDLPFIHPEQRNLLNAYLRPDPDVRRNVRLAIEAMKAAVPREQVSSAADKPRSGLTVSCSALLGGC
jgi:hypothetical protein